MGTVIEANVDPSLGPVATVLINTGNLHVGDNFVIGRTYGRVKLMKDHTGKKVKELLPSATAQIAGFGEAVQSGQILQVVRDEKTARQQASKIKEMQYDEDILKGGMGMSEILLRIKEGSLKLLKVIIKADTNGSLEAIKHSLAKVKSDDVAIKIIHSGVGTITESDVMMASASEGMILAFTTDFDAPNVSKTAEREMVEVRQYKIIYNLLEDVNKILSGLMEPEIVETLLGRAELKKIFITNKRETIIGARVLSGKDSCL